MIGVQPSFRRLPPIRDSPPISKWSGARRCCLGVPPVYTGGIGFRVLTLTITRRAAMLYGEKLRLRTVRESDLDQLFALQSDLSNRGDYYPLDLPSEIMLRKEFQETGFWKSDSGTLLLCDNDDHVLGMLSFEQPKVYHNNALEIGYILYDVASRGQGIMTEAVSLLVTYLFASKNVNRIEICADPGNTASRRVAEKCGFTFEGVTRSCIRFRGQDRDVVVYSLLRHEAGARSAGRDAAEH